MPRLSRPIEALKHRYSVVIVGSGYGGGVAASRLARAGAQVCVLERGREYVAGEFPGDAGALRREFRIDAQAGAIGQEVGLFDLRLGDDIHTLVGSGVGGTSLINAGVCLRPELRVFDDPLWPAALRADARGSLEEGFRRAEAMLRPRTYPGQLPRLAKQRALLDAGEALEERAVLLDVAVSYEEGRSPAGLPIGACKLCGDCVTGCNYEAKNTVAATYLPDAVQFGAEIFTEVAVRRIERGDGEWLVFYDAPGMKREGFEGSDMFLRAELVILAAGTLGSTEILLRSRLCGLRCSNRLGTRFSGNGDVIAFGYNTRVVHDAFGWGGAPAQERPPVGPTLTAMIDGRYQEELDEGYVIQDGAAPGSLAALAAVGLSAAAAVRRARDRESIGERDAADTGRALASVAAGLDEGPYAGALRNTSIYIVTSHDDAGGVMALDDDRVRISWPQVGLGHQVERIHGAVDRLVSHLGGITLPNPLWAALRGHGLITVHPLGGCPMADDAVHGVVNDRGQVFADSRGDAVHDGLYVCDGSIIPRSLGANPLLTICALAERAVAAIADQRGWRIAAGDPPDPRPLPLRDTPVGVAFTEAMRGHVSTAVVDERYQEGERLGARDGSRFDVVLTIYCRDLDRTVADPEHVAGMTGTVDAPALSPVPLTISEGRFNLFVDAGDGRTKNLRYRMKMHSREGRSYYFSGFKVVRDDRGLDLWSDMTTLYSTIHAGEDEGAPVLARGIIHVQLGDFLKQVASMRVTGVDPTPAQRRDALLTFGRFFGFALLDVYAAAIAKIVD